MGNLAAPSFPSICLPQTLSLSLSLSLDSHLSPSLSLSLEIDPPQHRIPLSSPSPSPSDRPHQRKPSEIESQSLLSGDPNWTPLLPPTGATSHHWNHHRSTACSASPQKPCLRETERVVSEEKRSNWNHDSRSI